MARAERGLPWVLRQPDPGQLGEINRLAPIRDLFTRLGLARLEKQMRVPG